MCEASWIKTSAHFRPATLNLLWLRVVQCHLWQVLSHLPDSNPTTASADVAHLFLLGLTRHEIFWLLDDLIPSCFSWDDLNAAAKALDLPKGHR